MAETLHRYLTGDQIHRPYCWEFGNESIRLASSGYLVSDFGRVGRQMDDNSLWMLINNSPITWQRVLTLDTDNKLPAVDAGKLLNTRLTHTARKLGGSAFKELLDIRCFPSLEMKVEDGIKLTNGVPTGFTFTRGTPATAFGLSGNMYTAGNNELRHEWDVLTGEYKGILLEGASTNLFTYSEDLTDASWLVSGTITKTSATRLTYNSLNSYLHKDVVIPNDTLKRTVSFRVYKTSSMANVNLSIIGSGGVSQNLGVTLIISTGVLTSVTATEYGVIDLGDSWRVWITHTNNGQNTLLSTRILLITGYLDISQLQLEEGHLTSYIATTSSTATRNADKLIIDTSTFTFNSTQGTVYLELARNNKNFLNEMIGVSLDNNLSTALENSITIYNPANTDTLNGRTSTTADGITCDILCGNIVNDTYYKVALGYIADGFKTIMDGGSLGSDVSCTVPTIARLTIGSTSNSLNSWYGHVKQLIYFPRKLSNIELLRLTT